MMATMHSPADFARALPMGFASYASRGRWRSAHVHRLINQRLMDVAAGRINRLIVSMPPQHGKSTLISGYFPTHYLGTFPNDEVIVAGYEASFASTWGERARDNMAEFGPDLWGLNVKSNARAAHDWRIVQLNNMRNAGGMRTAGIGSGITGRPMDLGIIDDPFKDAQQAMSSVYRQRVWDWYESSFASRFKPTTRVVLVMTRWHEDDIVGRLLELEADRWTVLRLPALAEDSDDPLGRAEGEALWPERFPREFLENVRDSRDAYWWASLYQQRPAPAGGGVFKKAWWKFWHPVRSDMPPVTIRIEGGGTETVASVEMPTRLDRIVQSWDLTFDSASSRVVGLPLGQRGADVFLLGQERGEWDFQEQIDAIRRMSKEYPQSSAKLVEKKANAAAALRTLRNEVPGLLPREPDGDKITRARAVSIYVRSGNVYLPHPAIAPWVWDFIDELTHFPTGRFDDRVDALSQGLHYLFNVSSSIVTDPAAWPTLRG